MNENRRSKTQYRLLLGLGMADFFASTSTFLSTWPMPVGAHYLASGTQQTCQAAGFLLQLYVLSVLYNGCLTLHYLLVVRYGWKEPKLKKIEPWMHAFSLMFGIGTAIFGAVIGAYHNAGTSCWFAPPAANYNAYRWAFMYGPIWVTIPFTFYSMAMMFWTVRKQEKAVEQYMQRGEQGARSKYSKKVAVQATFYCSVFLLTWSFGTVNRFTQLVGGKVPFPLRILQSFFAPLQGFFNCLVYLRPKYVAYRKKYPEMSTCELIKNTVLWTKLSRRFSSITSTRWSSVSRLSQHDNKKADSVSTKRLSAASAALSNRSSENRTHDPSLHAKPTGTGSSQRMFASVESIAVKEEGEVDIADVEEGKAVFVETKKKKEDKFQDEILLSE